MSFQCIEDMSISPANMFPQAKLQVFRSSAIRKLSFAERYLVVGHVSGDFAVLDLICRHNDAETCEHQRALQVGPCWYFDCYGDVLVTGNTDCKIRLWDLSTGSLQVTLTGHTRKPHAILFPNPTTIISAAENGELILWDIPSRERRRTLAGHNDAVVSLKVHNNLLASGSRDGTVRIYDMGSTSTECRHVLDGHTSYVGLLGFSPNGTLLATGAGGGEIKIWDVDSGSCRATCVGHTKVATQFFNHSNDRLISSSADSTIRTWEGQLVLSLILSELLTTLMAITLYEDLLGIRTT
ncbi:WD40 repeat-like protein [Amniculicola lignicola CBS 123094]|uniref:Mitochondrial division protein 1 n=1 Tax=Amniculicola lignicola CBS 123094 TaxID=1392246 RepID=A0A6A5W7K4_9PLEO|nr:WD40 repeat-like protein [Amniculicola lignicola CBS 123094]